jgi:hypothetical protein
MASTSSHLRHPQGAPTYGSHGGLRVRVPGCCHALQHPGPRPAHSTGSAPGCSLVAVRTCRRLGAEEVRRCALAAGGLLGAAGRPATQYLVLTPASLTAQPSELLPATLRRRDSCCCAGHRGRRRHGAGPGCYAACVRLWRVGVLLPSADARPRRVPRARRSAPRAWRPSSWAAAPALGCTR